MGDLIDFLAYKEKKRIREQCYQSYTAWVAHRFLAAGANGTTNRYDLAVEEQREGGFYLYKYFFPDFDW